MNNVVSGACVGKRLVEIFGVVVKTIARHDGLVIPSTVQIVACGIVLKRGVEPIAGEGVRFIESLGVVIESITRHNRTVVPRSEQVVASGIVMADGIKATCRVGVCVLETFCKVVETAAVEKRLYCSKFAASLRQPNRAGWQYLRHRRRRRMRFQCLQL